MCPIVYRRDLMFGVPDKVSVRVWHESRIPDNLNGGKPVTTMWKTHGLFALSRTNFSVAHEQSKRGVVCSAGERGL